VKEQAEMTVRIPWHVQKCGAGFVHIASQVK